MAATAPPWRFEDFFKLNLTDELAMKRQLAAKLRVRHADFLNGAQPFACSVNGIAPYDPDAMKSWYQELATLRAQGSTESSEAKSTESSEAKSAESPAAKSAESAKVSLNKLSCKAVVVNGCQVAWSNSLRPNVGYIAAWATANLARWDTGLERKAGGIDLSSTSGVQRFVTTNTSSLWALLATVVFQFKTQQDIDQNLVDAFVRIRLLVYANATADELMVPSQR
jgi:hypothetical protein